MALLPILTAPDPRLKQKSAPVTTFDDDLRRLTEDMLETMYVAPGIGLAAIQIGVAKRVIVIDVAREGEPPAPMRIVNPEITWASDRLAPYEEGCLSVPEHYADVMRPDEVKLRYQDETGRVHEKHCTGLLAVCIQHEIDHLDGVLFVDHLSSLKRNMILKKLQKQKKMRDDAHVL